MLTQDVQLALLNRAVLAGDIAAEDAMAAEKAAQSSAAEAGLKFTFGPGIDELLQCGKLSEARLRALLEEVRVDALAATLAPAATAAQSSPKNLPLDATLEGNGEAGQAPSSSGSARVVVGGGRDGGDAELGPTASQFPVPNWDRYEFLKLLGRGGMGEVYKARDRRLGRIVALKFIRGGDEQMTRRFLQEARAQSRVEHPSICKVYDVGEINGKAYIAMQFIDGLSLQQAVKSLSLIDKVQLIRDAAEALHTAHEAGIIHRDIKPANIMVERVSDSEQVVRNHPVVMDFGLAREASEGKGLTESGAVMGTPSYMSPEQARGEVRQLDRRTDVYSLGATLYDLLSGAPPFEDESVVNVILKVLNEDVRPLREKLPDFPRALDTIVNKSLNKEAAQRYSTAQELASDLGRFLGNQRIVGKKTSLLYRLQYRARRNPTVAALLMVMLFGLVGFGVYGIRNRLQSLQREKAAKLYAELTQQMGQTVKEMEWLTRVAYGLPLHDATKEKNLVRARMAQAERELASHGQLAGGLGHYVLGCGHLALQEWETAYGHLQQAEAQGVHAVELDYALGRSLGEIYAKGIEDAHRSGDKSFFAKRKKELAAQYLTPALAYLGRSRSLTTVSTNYVEALIDFYNEQYDAALLNTQKAFAQNSWLYEAQKLEGDVFAARALQQKDRGEYEESARNYQESINRYEQAAKIGRSDYRIYEAIAESWIRSEEIDDSLGRDPQSKLQEALAASDSALQAAPADSHGYTKKAYAYNFKASYEQRHGTGPTMAVLLHSFIDAGEHAVQLHSKDEYANDAVGLAYFCLGLYQEHRGESYEKSFAVAKKYFQAALGINKNFPWAYNELGLVYMLEGHFGVARNVDPTSQFKGAEQSFYEALRLDEEYFIAHTNLLFVYINSANWLIEHGHDPLRYISLTSELLEKIIKINKDCAPAYTNAACVYTKGIIYDYYRNDVSHFELLANTAFTRSFEFNKSILDTFVEYAKFQYWRGMHQLRSRRDPSAMLQAGLDAIKTCHDLAHGAEPGCDAAEALLLILRAEWQLQHGDSPLLSLDQAMTAAESARRNSSKDTNILLADGEVAYRSAKARSALRQPVGAEFKEGFAALDQALALAPGWPRALAVRGALYFLLAKTQVAEAARRSSIRRAQADLSQAVVGNPLLKNIYGDVIQAVEAESKEAL